MSRVKRFAHSLLSGYLLVGVNIIYTLISVPLALHYLSKTEFGLWALVMQMSGFSLTLIDLGMSGSLSRILIDYKDEKESTNYGSVIQTGVLVLLVQGVLIAALGSLLSFWLPRWMNVPGNFWHLFRILMASQCMIMGIAYIGRIFGFILQAHQRFDVCNYLNAGGFFLNLFVLWICFKNGLGLYSMLISVLVNALFNITFSALIARKLGFFPVKGYWGQPRRTMFRELFFYGTEFFLLSIGQQLIAASTVPVVSRTMGLEAAAVWSIAVKVFMLAQQLVYRISDFSFGALAEMMVRGEGERLKTRFHDVLILTGCAATAALVLALCNQSFLKIWTGGDIAWSPANDLLMAISFFVYSVTRVPIGFVCMTKRIGAMKFVYFAESAVFVGTSLLLARLWGFKGIIISGIVTNLLFSGVYGAYRITHYFDISYRNLLGSWLNRPFILFLAAGIAGLVFWVATKNLGAYSRLAINAALFGTTLGFLFWRIGLPLNIRKELLAGIQSIRMRFKF